MLVTLAAAAEEEQHREKRQITFGGTSFGNPATVSPSRGTLYAVSHGNFNLGGAPSYSANPNPYVEYAWRGFSSPYSVSYQPVAYAQPAAVYPEPESRPAPAVGYEYGVKIAHQPTVSYPPSEPLQHSYGTPCE